MEYCPFYASGWSLWFWARNCSGSYQLDHLGSWCLGVAVCQFLLSDSHLAWPSNSIALSDKEICFAGIAHSTKSFWCLRCCCLLFSSLLLLRLWRRRWNYQLIYSFLATSYFEKWLRLYNYLYWNSRPPRNLLQWSFLWPSIGFRALSTLCQKGPLSDLPPFRRYSWSSSKSNFIAASNHQSCIGS